MAECSAGLLWRLWERINPSFTFSGLELDGKKMQGSLDIAPSLLCWRHCKPGHITLPLLLLVSFCYRRYKTFFVSGVDMHMKKLLTD